MKRSLILFISFIVFVFILFAIISTIGNNAKKMGAVEMISFSHQTHFEKYNIKDCGTCHKYDANKTFRGLPAIGECTVCHDRNGELTSDDHMKPRKKTMFDSYTDKDKPWVSRAKDSQLLYYSHKAAWATQPPDDTTKFRCESCHGDKVSSTGTARLKGEKLMGQCIECHTSYKMNNQCDVCHR